MPAETDTIVAPPAAPAPAEQQPIPPAKPAAPPAAGAPPADVKPPAEPGAETVSAFADRFTGRKKAAAKPPVEKKPDAPPAPPKPKAAAKPPVVVQPAAEPDYEKLGQAVAKGIVDAQKQTAAPPAPTDRLTDEQKETVAVLERMEKEWPDTYKGHKEKFIEASLKAASYREQWEKDHPGETFDPEGEEHNEFFSANEVDWEDNHYVKMLARIEAEKIAEKTASKTKEELAEIKQRERLRDSEAAIIGRQVETAREFFDKLGEEYKAVLDANGNINVEEVKRLQGADPIKTIAFQSARNVELFAGELHKLVEGLASYDEKNPIHREVARFISEEERLMKSLPPEQSVFQGKAFATAEEYAAMSAEKRQKHWRYTEKDLARINAARAAEAAKEWMTAEEARLESFAKARGFKKVDAQSPASTPAPAERDAYVLPSQKPLSPSGTVGPIIAPAAGAGGKGANSATSSFLTRFRG